MKTKKPAKLILVDELSKSLKDDGIHYYAINNREHDNLDVIEHSIYEILTKITGVKFRDHFKTVGSWKKKEPGNYHKDLDLITSLSNNHIGRILENLPYPAIFYKGLSTWTFVIKDILGIPRKVDIFKVESVPFSEKAYFNVPYMMTEWPSWARNMILNSICKIVVKNDEGWTGRFIPYRGLCMYDDAPKNKESKILTTDWDAFKVYIGFPELNTVEDLINRIKKTWSDKQKIELINLLSKDKKLVNLLENNNKRVMDISNEIY